jgi:hypothetical protein
MATLSLARLLIHNWDKLRDFLKGSVGFGLPTGGVVSLGEAGERGGRRCARSDPRRMDRREPAKAIAALSLLPRTWRSAQPGAAVTIYVARLVSTPEPIGSSSPMSISSPALSN